MNKSDLSAEIERVKRALALYPESRSLEALLRRLEQRLALDAREEAPR